MPRYFLELAYKGTNYAGFQVQENANTIQAEVEKALNIYFRRKFELTGSSRTDAGVHAKQNFFHFDDEAIVEDWDKTVYHLNAILPPDIVIHSIRQVEAAAHSRFDAVSRSYEYSIYRKKDPFLDDRAYYFPFKLDIGLLNEAATIIRTTTDFESFAKRNAQVFTYNCSIIESRWVYHTENLLQYQVTGNRFLRGMVRGLTGTMLKVGTGKLTLEQFEQVIAARNPAMADFSVPAQGLMLVAVNY
jgi:tRNA pseudouridine38-40 synthase